MTLPNPASLAPFEAPFFLRSQDVVSKKYFLSHVHPSNHFSTVVRLCGESRVPHTFTPPPLLTTFSTLTNTCEKRLSKTKTPEVLILRGFVWCTRRDSNARPLASEANSELRLISEIE